MGCWLPIYQYKWTVLLNDAKRDLATFQSDVGHACAQIPWQWQLSSQFGIPLTEEFITRRPTQAAGDKLIRGSFLVRVISQS